MKRFLNDLLKQNWKGAKVLHHAVIPDRKGVYGTLKEPLSPKIANALTRLGIRKLYRHQARALDEIRAGKHVIVSTPTSSGKSLIYNIAAAEAFLEAPERRALYLFPIKALSRDQLGAIQIFFNEVESDIRFHSAVYDGDTTPYMRSKIRQHHPHILITNPDMLHYALLPYHSKWELFWKRLHFIVVDEMHTYRGIFGSHVAQIFRRLKRICSYYGSSPQFILLSATIGNPDELAQQLINVEMDSLTVINDHGAPQSKRHFLFLQADEAARMSMPAVAARLLTRAADYGLKTIAFTQSRKLTELVHMNVLRIAPHLKGRVSSYRAGFLPEERRQIEQQLADGSISAVVSTSALEMGIDIGGLDLCILVGYPGTVMTTWQRGGRVGRSGQESAIVLIPQMDALDQYIIQNPDELLKSRFEQAVTDPNNSEILAAHLPCAAHELPLKRMEIDPETEVLKTTVEELTRSGRLVQTADGEQWLSKMRNPHRSVDIRTIGQSYSIFRTDDKGKRIPLGKSDGIRALKECHPGAVYLHRGIPYHVEELDLKNHLVSVTSKQISYFTRTRSEKETDILEVMASKPAANFVIRLGRLKVTEKILAYEKRRLHTQELLGISPLDLPPQVFETVGLWIEIDPVIADKIRAAKLHFMGGIHAIEHALISMFPLFALCDRNDIGGIATPQHPQVGKSAVFIYDGYPGGIGLAARGYEIIMPLLEKTLELIDRCKCSEGCPACIHSPKCGSGNKPLDKEAARATLNYLLGKWPLTQSVTEDKHLQDDFHKPPARQETKQNLEDYRIGFFDLETQRLANEVGGWRNKHLMRLSVAVIYEHPGDTFHIYKEENVTDLIDHLNRLDLVVGFNIEQFDYEVLRPYTPRNLKEIPTFDILKEIHQILGFRISLDHLGFSSLNRSKSADGIQAVKWFREGNWDELIDYCKDDVALTRDLFFFALKKGYLLYRDRNHNLLRIPTPWRLADMVAKKSGRQ